MTSHRLLPLILGAVFAASLSFAPDCRAQQARPHVDQAVHQALKAGSARVVVTLDVPRRSDLAQMRAAVANAQSQVLQGLDPGAHRVLARYSHLPLLSLEVAPQALPALLARPGVRAVNLDRVRFLSDAESHALTHVEALHLSGAGGDGVRVAVVDSGVNATHESLSDDIFAEACFRTEGDCPAGTSGPGSAQDQNGHGTHVTGTITGASGNAPDAEVVALKVFTTSDTSDTNIFNALDAIVSNDATWQVDIVNMSLGSTNYATQASCDADHAGYVSTFATLNSMGIAVFVATGNDADINGVGAPGCVTGAIGVGSVSDAVFTIGFSACTENGAADKVTCFSNTTSTQGDGELLDILAPGCLITAEWIGSTTATESICGTSMATPTAAGIGASLLSYDPSLSPLQLEELLEATADPVVDYRNGVSYPRINAEQAFGEIAISLPVPPAGLTALVVDPARIDLAWGDIDGEDEYQIHHSTNGDSWSLLATVAADSIAHVDTPVGCGPQFYRVRGVETGVGFSAFSNVASATARACPGAPTALTATVLSGTSVQLDWIDNASGETGFSIERSDNGGAWVEIATEAANAVQHLDDGLTCALFQYRVRAHSSALDDYSAYSNVAAASPCAPANDRIENAEPVSVNTVDDEPAIRYATIDAGDPSPSCRFSGAAQGSNSVWYVLTPAVDGTVSIETSGSDLTGGGSAVLNDTVVAIYPAVPADADEIECNDDISGANLLSRISNFPLAAGQTYHVLVTRWDSTPLTYDGMLRTSFVFGPGVPVPANDRFANAEVIAPEAMPYLDSEPEWRYARRNALDPLFTPMGDCSASFFPVPGTNTLWYAFTPDANGTLDVDNSSSSAQDTVIGVYTGSYPALVQVACNDQGGTGNTSFVDDLPLSVGTPYFIHVARWSNAPLASAATSAVAFSFTAVPTPPVAFDLTGPADASETELPEVPAGFDWTASSNADSYTLVINDGNSDVLSLPGLTGDDYALSAGEQSLLEVGSYTWNVTAHNSDGTTASSNGPFGFAIAADPRPGAFSLVGPADAVATTLPLVPASFQWTAAADAQEYTLRINDGSSDVLVKTGLAGTDYALTAGEQLLLGAGSYTWDVTASNTDGDTASGNGPFSFTIAPSPLPGAFALLLPANGTRTVLPVVPLEFSWSPAAGAESYTLTIDDGNSDVVVVEGLTATSHALDAAQQAVLDAGEGSYSWSVVAINADGQTVVGNAPFAFAVVGEPIFSDSFEVQPAP